MELVKGLVLTKTSAIRPQIEMKGIACRYLASLSFCYRLQVDCYENFGIGRAGLSFAYFGCNFGRFLVRSLL